MSHKRENQNNCLVSLTRFRDHELWNQKDCHSGRWIISESIFDQRIPFEASDLSTSSTLIPLSAKLSYKPIMKFKF